MRKENILCSSHVVNFYRVEVLIFVQSCVARLCYHLCVLMYFLDVPCYAYCVNELLAMCSVF